MLQKANRRSTLLWAAAAVLACLAVEYVSFGLSQMDWSVSLLYGGDGVSGVNGVKEALRGGGLLGWPFYEPPAGTDPNYSMLYTIYLTLAGLFTDNFALVFNLYILLIPVLNTAVSFFALRSLQVRGWLAFAGALTFGLCPYVQQRLNGHMGLAAVECIPLVFLLCLWCAEDDRFNRPGKGFFRYRRNWLSLLFAWAIANNGMVYYPFFGCFLLCVVALCLLLRDKHPRVLAAPLVTVAEIAGWLAVGFLPMVFGILTGAGSTATAGAFRGPTGADIYGLRISSLLLSPNGYGVGKIAEWIGRYMDFLSVDEGIVYNENAFGYLGIVGILGFLLLLVWLFASRPWQKKQPGPELSDRLWLFSRLNIAMLLLATITGFGAMIGIVLRMIRGYNRISPYIAFLAILAVVLCVEQLLQKLQTAKRIRFAAAMVLVCAVFAYGFWEQQGMFRPDYAGVQTAWAQDAAFVREIEQVSGADAMVYQLPYMKSFENGPENKMPDYTLLRGTLHSDTLRWSYGGAYGGENDLWNQAASQLEPADMVAELKDKGFAGIYLDRDGYTNDTLEQALCSLPDCGEPIVSAGGTLVYIPFVD